VPAHYALAFSLPDPDESQRAATALSYSGRVLITADVNAPTSCVVLNAGAGLNITTVSVNGVALPSTSVAHDAAAQQLTLMLASAAGPGGHEGGLTIDVSFTNRLRDDTDPSVDDRAHGIFLSPNSVPPPTPATSKAAAAATALFGSEDSDEARAEWRLHGGQRREEGRQLSDFLWQYHQDRLRRSGATQTPPPPSWRESLRTARANGTPLMIATQLEEMDARNMFPCFDEPGYKATFNATIDVPTSSAATSSSPIKSPPLMVLFNTAETSRHDDPDGRTFFHFENTLHPLPTYLVALAVGRFDTLERTSRGVDYRLVVPPGKSAWAELAMNATVHAIEFFGDRFELPYSTMNPKLDSISVGGIDMDAMENQGLVTYAPQMLLLNPNATELPPAPCGSWGRFAQAQLIVFVTTHELLHQWFGDTVTMRWWSQEYLNEGFARLMQSYGSDDLVPDWDVMGLTGRGQVQSNSFYRFSYEVAMQIDAPGTAPAITYRLPGGGDLPPFPPAADKQHVLSLQKEEGKDEEEVEEDPTKAPLFARIFYEKGATVNRMVATYLGWDLWNKALATQLRRFPWQNPTVEDLMRSMDTAFEAAGSRWSATEAMLPWLRRPGFPMVTVAFDAGTGVLSVAQEPISKYLPDADKAVWWVPLYVSLPNGTEVLFAFNTSSAQKVLVAETGAGAGAGAGTAASAVVVGDPKFRGMFVSRYPTPDAWRARFAVAASRHSAEPDWTRCLAHQVYLLGTMGRESASVAADMLSAIVPAMQLESAPIGGWEGFGDLATMLVTRSQVLLAVLWAGGAGNATATVALERAVRTLVGPLAARLGWSALEQQEAPAEAFLEKKRGAEANDATPPWPTHEDGGIESRASIALRPTALFAAVRVGDKASIAAALKIFREAASFLSGSSARSVYFAAGKYGTVQDRSKVHDLFQKALAAGRIEDADEQQARAQDLLFGVVADATDCQVWIKAISAARERFYPGTDKSTLAAAAAYVLSTVGEIPFLIGANECRDVVWKSLVVDAAARLWKMEGAAATGAIVKGVFATLSTAKELAAGTALLDTQGSAVVSVAARTAAIVGVQINMDVVAVNNGMRR
jgi:hypothetical protein